MQRIRSTRGASHGRRRAGRAAGSLLAVIMLVGTLTYVVRDNFSLGPAAPEETGPASEAQALSEQARVCLEQGDTALALDYARRAVQRDAMCLSAHLSLVAVLVSTEDFEGARAALAEAERLDPQHDGVESARQLLQQARR